MTMTYTKKNPRSRVHPSRMPRQTGTSLLNTVKLVPVTQLTFGTVAWARVPFIDGSGEKARPVVVLRSTRHDVTVLPITTSRRRFLLSSEHLEVGDLGSAGLQRPCGIALSPVSIDRIGVSSIVGELALDDETGLRKAIRSLLSSGDAA